jgi:hypothetical protein
MCDYFDDFDNNDFMDKYSLADEYYAMDLTLNFNQLSLFPESKDEAA